jgi:hypothetical protein
VIMNETVPRKSPAITVRVLVGASPSCSSVVIDIRDKVKVTILIRVNPCASVTKKSLEGNHALDQPTK